MSIVIVPNTDTFENWRVKTNTIGSGVGDLSTLVPMSTVSYTGLQGQNLPTFAGVHPALFDVDTVQGVYTVTIAYAGEDYTAGDTVIIPGSLIGGVDGVNDATITVTTVDTFGVGSIQSATITGTVAADLVAEVNQLRDDMGDTNTALTTDNSNIRDAINELEEVLRGTGLAAYALNTDAQDLVGGINELETAVRGTGTNYTLSTTAVDLVAAINEHETDIGTVQNFAAQGTSPVADATHTVTYVDLGADLTTAVNALKVKSDYLSDELGGDMSADYDGPETNHMDALNALYNASSLGTLDSTYVRRNGTLDMTGLFQIDISGITSNANNMLLKTGASDVTAIDISASNQNVGIGGSPGTHKLRVTGAINATTGLYYNGDDTDTRYIRADVGNPQQLVIDTTVTSNIDLNPALGKTVTIGGSVVATGGGDNFLEWFQDTVGAMFTGNSESGGVTGVYDDGTGKITLAVANNSHLHTSTNISDWQEAVEDTASSMITSATHSGLTVSYDDNLGRLAFNVNDPTLTFTGEVTGSGTLSNLSNLSIPLTLTTESVQDKVAPLLVTGAHTGLTATYDDTNNRINLALSADPIISLAGDVTGSVTLTNLATQTFTLTATVVDDSHNHVIGNIDNFVESVQDIVGGMVAAPNVESGLTVTYDDTNGKLNFDVVDPTITLLGDVTGSATMTNLGSINLTTSLNPSASTFSVFLRTDGGNTMNSNIIPNTNNSHNLGNSSRYWANLYATKSYTRATQADYADLAEKYLADADYAVGTVIAVGGEAEVTAATNENAHSVIGVVSENPAFEMNASLEGGTYIALKGRVPVRVTGDVKKGDRLVASEQAGVAEANNAMGMWSFAVALTDKVGDTVEAVIL